MGSLRIGIGGFLCPATCSPGRGSGRAAGGAQDHHRQDAARGLVSAVIAWGQLDRCAVEPLALAVIPSGWLPRTMVVAPKDITAGLDVLRVTFQAPAALPDLVAHGYIDGMVERDASDDHFGVSLSARQVRLLSVLMIAVGLALPFAVRPPAGQGSRRRPRRPMTPLQTRAAGSCLTRPGDRANVVCDTGMFDKPRSSRETEAINVERERARASLIAELFDEAAEMEPDKRSAYLDERCAGDPTLRRQVEALLRADCYTGSNFLDEPPAAPRSVSPSISSLEPSTTVGTYRIVGELGRGGMGVVYKAEHVSLDKHAVIKMLHPEFARQPAVVERFMNEAQALARCQDPGIVDVYDIGIHADRQVYIVLELLDGETLERRLRRDDRLTPQTALSFARQVARTLAVVHERGIIHRDLKPENLIIVRDREVVGGHRVKILDFGIAKLAIDHGGSGTKSGMVMGTPAYMSPEQCRGLSDVDERADLYALGVILFQMVTGRLPFVKQNSIEYLDAHRHEPIPELRGLAPDVAPDLAGLVMRLLRKPRDERFPSAKALVAAIDAIPGQTSEPQRDPRPAVESGSDEARARTVDALAQGGAITAPAVRAARHVVEFTEPQTGIRMVRIPGGVVAQAGDLGRLDAERLTRVPQFFLSHTPVVNRQYLRFVEATGYPKPALVHDPRYNGETQPVVGVSWHDAKAYCAWLSMASDWRFNLPSDAQWSVAARCGDVRRYPWGDTPPTPEHATFGGDLHADAPRPVGTSPAGASVHGAQELAGNVWEWCEDEWTFGDAAGDVSRPLGFDRLDLRVIRGGSYASGEEELRVSARRFHVADSGVRFVGIRLVAIPADVQSVQKM